NFSRLAEQGGFMNLGTSVPPQSPVAWSNFITGMDSGGHGIFDFIALDRKLLLPYQSTSKTEQPDTEPLAFGKWRIPLVSGKTLQMRDGQAFWEILEQHGVKTTMVSIPANYPPIETGGKAISGMGTPDMRGTSGTFSFYTDAPEFKAGKVSGGEIYRVKLEKHGAVVSIYGPPNPFLADNPSAEAKFSVHVDPENPVALIRTEDERVLLNVGEWSDWVTVRFELLPGLVSVQGMVRFLLKQTQPYFSLYASPVNIDPRDPAQPIASPAEYAFELAEQAGPFYTEEMPEDTKALSAHVLSTREFLTQSDIVLEERKRLLKNELQSFRDTQGSALLFFYFSSVDQRNHMLARQMDPSHPFHEKDTPEDLAMAMKNLYLEMDRILGWVMQDLPEGTSLVVMSDHGFAPFKRQANLNTWLEQNGYLALKNPAERDQYEWLFGIDWRKTKAFAIGLNSLYLNVRGRDRYGIVAPADRSVLAREIADKLKQWRDGPEGAYVVTQPLLREEVYHGPHLDEAPDILVGYARGYRASWATTSGKIPLQLMEDNKHEWSGDHCMDSRTVPGILLSNETLKTEVPSDLKDLTVGILDRFGIEPPSRMKGHSVF
ncbi:MAG: alkaline phosphatase family protein, partial [Methylococcaceae bacterium]|nr:alkaline phosphatase family protein [Methylococcaceae bacterium]